MKFGTKPRAPLVFFKTLMVLTLTLETVSAAEQNACMKHLRNRAARIFSSTFRVLFRDLNTRSITLKAHEGYSQIKPRFSRTAIQWLIFEKSHIFSNNREIQVSANLEFVPNLPQKPQQPPSQPRQLSLDFNPTQEISPYRLRRTLHLSVTSSTGTTGKSLELEWDGKTIVNSAEESTVRFKTLIALDRVHYYELIADVAVSSDNLLSEPLHFEPSRVQKIELQLIPVAL